MTGDSETRYVAFEGPRRIAAGRFGEVVVAAKEAMDRGDRGQILLFDDATGAQVDANFGGTVEDVRQRMAALAEDAGDAPSAESPPAEAPRGRGRPRLGVVAREVTLLPRHWEWLAAQPGGASVALRKLVEEARRASAGRDRARQAREAAYRFISAMAGNEPGFEEAVRALFAGDAARFAEMTEGWPPDVRAHAREMAARAADAAPE
jgi:hypothetical protein